jgi:hypothetical protein
MEYELLSMLPFVTLYSIALTYHERCLLWTHHATIARHPLEYPSETSYHTTSSQTGTNDAALKLLLPKTLLADLAEPKSHC